MIVPPEFTKEEQLLNDIESAVTAEGNRQGETYFQLPQKVDGVSLKWEEPKQHLLVKVLFFEIVIVVLLYFVEQEKKKTKEKERQDLSRACEILQLVNFLIPEAEEIAFPDRQWQCEHF